MNRSCSELSLKDGDQVGYHEIIWVIKSPVDLEQVLLENPLSGERVIARISDLISPVIKADEIVAGYSQSDISIIPEAAWQVALLRREIIEPLAKQQRYVCRDIKTASQKLNLTTRQIYNLIYKYQISGYQLRTLIPSPPSGGRGGSRLPQPVETVIQDVISELYLSRQKIKASHIIEEINRRCYLLKISKPSSYAIRHRLKQLPTKMVISKRDGGYEAKYQTGAYPGKTPESERPLAMFQIDHTLVDIIVVNALDRRPIGRPYLTIAIPYYKNSPGCVIDRGNPERTGVYKEQFSGHPKIAWQTSAPSLHTPICAGNLIITDPLMAFDATNGKKTWDASANTGRYNFQPTYYKGIIYWDKMVGSGGQEKSVNLIRYNAKTGKILDQKSFGIGSASGLFIYNDIAYVSLFDGLTAYDLKKNKILWKRKESPKFGLDGISTDGEILFFHVDNGGIYALNIKNGQLLWNDNTFFEMSYVTVGKENVYVSFSPFLDNKEGIIAYNKKTGKVIWQRYFDDVPGFNKNGYISSLTLHQDKLFFSNVVEMPIIPITEPTRYSPVGGGVYALDAQTGKLIWHTDAAPFTAPISINNTLYIGGQNILYALDEDTGKERWHLNVTDDVVYLVPYQNKLFLKLGMMSNEKLLAVF